MSKNLLHKNQEGFTLIEIIAVIIIMGILAAVAVPKFFSMQEDAKKAALKGAISEAAARFNHAYARYILDEKSAPANVEGVLDTSDYLGPSAVDPGEDIGDFQIKWEKNAGGELVITVVSMEGIDATALAAMDLKDRSKTINGVNWGN